MKKNILVFAIFLSFGLVSCTKTDSTNNSTNTTLSTTVETPVETPVEKTVQEPIVDKRPDQYLITVEELPQLNAPDPSNPVATIKTNYGDIKLELYPKYAPKTVENFLKHSEDGYYDGVKFHRIIEDFMIQGGDPEGTGMGGVSIYGEKFEDEFSPYLYNLNGAISMANGGPNSNGSQFFIVQNQTLDGEEGYYSTVLKLLSEDFGHEDVRGFLTSETNGLNYLGNGMPLSIVEKYIEKGGTPFLDYKHTVFGQVIEGMDTVNIIAAVEKKADARGEVSVPVDPVIIESIEIVRK